MINDVLDLSKVESDLRISTRPVADGRFRLRFAVVDTGPGIPAVLQNAVFEPFNQVHAWTDPKAGGVGLGLSISKHLAVLMGGEIQLRSEQDVGSTFTLDLPEVARAEPRGRIASRSSMRNSYPLPVSGSSTAAIPVIAVTAMAIGGRAKEAAQVCDGYLTQPVSKAALITAMAVHLGHDAAIQRGLDEPAASAPIGAPEAGGREPHSSADLRHRVDTLRLPCLLDRRHRGARRGTPR